MATKVGKPKVVTVIQKSSRSVPGKWKGASFIHVAVSVGSRNDPPEKNGLAHLCEHVLIRSFLSTLHKKIEDRNIHLSRHKANKLKLLESYTYDATTNLDHTVFSFAVDKRARMIFLNLILEHFFSPRRLSDREFVYERNAVSQEIDTHKMLKWSEVYQKAWREAFNIRNLCHPLGNKHQVQGMKFSDVLKFLTGPYSQCKIAMVVGPVGRNARGRRRIKTEYNDFKLEKTGSANDFKFHNLRAERKRLKRDRMRAACLVLLWMEEVSARDQFLFQFLSFVLMEGSLQKQAIDLRKAAVYIPTSGKDWFAYEIMQEVSIKKSKGVILSETISSIRKEICKLSISKIFIDKKRQYLKYIKVTSQNPLEFRNEAVDRVLGKPVMKIKTLVNFLGDLNFKSFRKIMEDHILNSKKIVQLNEL